MTQINLTPDTLVVGGKYNWKNQPERLSYIGRQRYQGDIYWYQFEKVDEPGIVWCEVLSSDLYLMEETKPEYSLQVTLTLKTYSRKQAIYAEIQNAFTKDLLVSATLDYCLDAIKDRNYKVVNAQECLIELNRNADFHNLNYNGE